MQRLPFPAGLRAAGYRDTYYPQATGAPTGARAWRVNVCQLPSDAGWQDPRALQRHGTAPNGCGPGHPNLSYVCLLPRPGQAGGWQADPDVPRVARGFQPARAGEPALSGLPYDAHAPQGRGRL